MDLQNLRQGLNEAMKLCGKSQYRFSAAHGLSYSTLNKFLKGHLANPRLSTLLAYERAIAAAKQVS